MDFGGLGEVFTAVGNVFGDALGVGIQAHENRRAARTQMHFQERMRNTQYQAAAKDLEAAGLNRILALGSPAASPAGASYSIDAPKLGTSAVAGASAAAAMRVQKEQESLIKSQKLREDSQKALNDVSSAKSAVETLKAQEEVANAIALRGQISAQTRALMSQSSLHDANARLARAEAAKAEATKYLYDKGGPAVRSLIDKAFDLFTPDGEPISAAPKGSTSSPGRMPDLGGILRKYFGPKEGSRPSYPGVPYKSVPKKSVNINSLR